MTDTFMNTLSDELALRLESALRGMPSINHGPLDKGDYSRAVKRLALAIHDTTAALRASIPGGVGVNGLAYKTTLAECPVGLFIAGSGELCLKTEYGSNEGRIDAYIVSSGEFFWGGTSLPAEQRKVLVTPAAPSNPMISDEVWQAIAPYLRPLVDFAEVHAALTAALSVKPQSVETN